MTDYRGILLGKAQAVSAKTGLALATIGTRVAKDGKFFDRISSGGGFTMDTYLNVLNGLENMLSTQEKTPPKGGGV